MAKTQNINCENVKRLTKCLAGDISEKYQIDSIIAIARGGIIPARYLATYLNVRKIYTIGVQFYSDVDKTFKVPHVYQQLPKNLPVTDFFLICDDIVDSGESMGVVINQLTNLGVKRYITCALHYKPKSTYKPTFYGEKLDNNVWAKYDWE